MKSNAFAGVAMFFGVITIPFDFVHFKLVRMAIWTIGAKVVSKELRKSLTV